MNITIYSSPSINKNLTVDEQPKQTVNEAYQKMIEDYFKVNYNNQRACYHCGIQDTPQWRKGPNGKHTLCNACGQQYKKIIARQNVKHKYYEHYQKNHPGHNPAINNLLGHPNAKFIKNLKAAFPINHPLNKYIINLKVCTQCNEISTPQWRQGPHGVSTLCNACGIAFAEMNAAKKNK